MNHRILQTLGSVGIAWAMIHASPSMHEAPRPAVLTISRGGTYTGQWESDDPAVPVIRVNTAEAVVIENSTLRGRGTLIQAGVDHTNITVRNTRGIGLNPNVAGKPPGRFFSAESFDSVVIEHNEIEGTGGIYLLTYAGDPASETTIEIVRNRAHNIDGCHSDGAGGYLTDADLVQFVQLDKVRHVPHVEIAWNQVINDPGASAVEDVISIYLSSGTRASPIRIHDNYIDGAYPARLAAKDFSGGGIMLGDGQADSPGDVSSFVEASGNQVINTTNYGIAISAGHDCVMSNNRIVSTGTLPDGTPLPAQNVGAYIWNTKHARTFASNSGNGNYIGWAKPGGRNDWWVPDAAMWKDNIHWPGPISAQSLADERRLWVQKLADRKATIGVN